MKLTLDIIDDSDLQISEELQEEELFLFSSIHFTFLIPKSMSLLV